MHGKSRIRSGFVSVCLTALMLILPAVTPASAAQSAEKKVTRVIRPILPSPEKDAAIVVDGATGKVLYARNPDAIRYPASLTKMMTLYLLFEALDKGTINLDTPLITSVHASEQEPTKLAMGAGAPIPVETAIKAITVLSANDVAVVIAEALGGGSEETFASMMTEKAHQLGMTHTNFHNASGLPDLQQLTTARDMALLARHLAYDFPQYYHYFSTLSFTFNGRAYGTHDNLLAAFEGADGIKTGYTIASGFNLVTSAVRDNKHVVGVVMGGPTAAVRDHEMMRLLSATFEVAKDNPTILADANVPWEGGKGPDGERFGANPGEDDTVLLAALEPKAKSRSKAKAPAQVMVASAKDGPAVAAIVPAVQAPAMAPVLTPAIAPANETASLLPASSHEPGGELLQHDPLKPPPLRLGPAPSLRLADASQPIAQGDGASVPSPAAFVPAAPAKDSAVKRWAVQIGAFASETLAQTRLAAFATRGADIIGQAQKLVIAFPSKDGHILYRARLGMFAESEARDICKRMVQRGQTCVPALADAG